MWKKNIKVDKDYFNIKKCDYYDKCINIIDNNKISSEELLTEQIKLIEELEVIKTKMQRICSLNINNNI